MTHTHLPKTPTGISGFDEITGGDIASGIEAAVSLAERKRSPAIITAERGERSLTRYGLEEYVADCVVLLDHRVLDQVSTRRLRVVKNIVGRFTAAASIRF